MESKLATACGLPPESVRQLTEAYERKLVRARVADLEANVPTGGIEATVFAAIRPFFSEEQKNLPRSFADLSERISAVKDEALKEVKAAHQWLGGTSVGESSLPALAYEAWLTLVEVKVATGCGLPIKLLASRNL